MPSMEPFVPVPGHPFLACRACQHCVLSNALKEHLHKKHRGHHTPKEAIGIEKAVKALAYFDSLIATYKQLKEHNIPPGPMPAIELLGDPKMGGVACRHCPQVMSSSPNALQNMRQHILKEHKAEINGGTHDLSDVVWQRHYKEDCLYQQFFLSGPNSHLIEVSDEKQTIVATRGSNTPDIEEVAAIWRSTFEEIQQRAAATFQPRVNISDLDITNANGWLNRTGFPHHLQNLGAATVFQLRQPPSTEEPVLGYLDKYLKAFVHWLVRCAGTVCREDINSAGFVETNGKEPALKPFRVPQQDPTISKYGETLRTVFRFFVRSRDLDRREGCRWKQTVTQCETFDTLYAAAVEAVARDTAVPSPCENDPLTRAMMDFLTSLWDHILKGSHEESVLYSALSAMALKKNGGWVPVQLFTPRLAALKCISKCLVLVQCSMEYKGAVRAQEQSGDLEHGDADIPGVADRVRARVRKFLAPQWDADNRSTPAMWIDHTLSYGLRIAQQQPHSSEHDIYWSDKYQTINMAGSSFRMCDLRDFAAKMVFDLRQLLAKLLMLRTTACLDSEAEAGGPPSIPWGSLDDSMCNRDPFVSFFESNAALYNSPRGLWILRRILSDRALCIEWFNTSVSSRSTSSPHLPFKINQDTVAKYRMQMRRFLELMALCFHTLCGQPPRCPEITSIRWCNSASGNLRNIFVLGPLMYFLTQYHKKQQQFDRSQPVYRLLPAEVRDCLLYYLWLVLPFYHQVHVQSGDHDHVLNPYLFTDEFCLPPDHPGLNGATRIMSEPSFRLYPNGSASKIRSGSGHRRDGSNTRPSSQQGALLDITNSEADRGEEGDALAVVNSITNVDSETEGSTDDDREPDEGDEVEPHHCRGSPSNSLPTARWAASRVATLFSEYACQNLADNLGIRPWRHYCITIQRQHCPGHCTTGSMASNNMRHVNPALEQQPGHSAATGLRHYGRLEETANHGPEHERGAFFMVSTAWQTFLGLTPPSRDPQSGSGFLEPAHGKAEAALQRRRFEELRNADLQYWLRDLCGEGNPHDPLMSPPVEFRLGQLETLQSIIDRHPFVLQIAGTGVGKSLTFQLLARAQPSGTTIVIVPLLSLQADVAERCEKADIDVHVYRPDQPGRCASIVLVTPELFCSQSFHRFTLRLRQQSLLDRIVCDEAHLVLEVHDKYRPSLLDVPRRIMQLGVQVVMLTATLPPESMCHFFRRFAITQPKAVTVIRNPTRRSNIRYCVKTVQNAAEERNSAIREALHLHRKYKRVNGKVVVFARTKRDAEEIAATLGCDFYHAESGTEAEKDAVLRVFSQPNKATIVVATSAFGLGCHIPGIRGVVHCGTWPDAPYYIQSSGRAGRDGENAEAVLVKMSERIHHGVEPSQMHRYVIESQCRRLIIDNIMDGVEIARDGRACGPGEAPCDLCCSEWDLLELPTSTAKGFPTSSPRPPFIDDSAFPVASSHRSSSQSTLSSPAQSYEAVVGDFCDGSESTVGSPQPPHHAQVLDLPPATSLVVGYTDGIETERSGGGNSVRSVDSSPDRPPLRQPQFNPSSSPTTHGNGRAIPRAMSISSPSSTQQSRKRQRSPVPCGPRQSPLRQRPRYTTSPSTSPASSRLSRDSPAHSSTAGSSPWSSVSSRSNRGSGSRTESQESTQWIQQHAKNARLRQIKCAEEHDVFSDFIERSRGACLVCLAVDGTFRVHGEEACRPSRSTTIDGQDIPREGYIESRAEELQKKIRHFFPDRPFRGCTWCLQPHRDCQRWTPWAKQSGTVARYDLSSIPKCRDQASRIFELYFALYLHLGAHAEKLVREHASMTTKLEPFGRVTSKSFHDEQGFHEWASAQIYWKREETFRFNSLLVGLIRASKI